MVSKKSPIKLMSLIAGMLDGAANPSQNFPRYIIEPNKKSIIITIKKNQIKFTPTTYQVNFPPEAPTCLTAQRIPNSHGRSHKTFQKNKKLYVYTTNDNNKHRFSQYWLILTKSINKVIYTQKCAFCQKYKKILLLTLQMHKILNYLKSTFVSRLKILKPLLSLPQIKAYKLL
jgi:hypothetical protein